MTSISSQCSACRHHRFGTGGWCAAYPAGIPDAVALNEVIHDRVLPDQVGDTVYEPKEGCPATFERTPPFES